VTLIPNYPNARPKNASASAVGRVLTGNFARSIYETIQRPGETLEHSTISLSSSLEPSLPAPFDISALENQSDDDLDLFPFGIVCINEEGVILKYNLAEARLARLDRNQVLGKNFFRVVAPCTATETFEGRFRSFIKPGNTEPNLRFPYVFDFKFGAQEVDIEFVRPREKGPYYFYINRRQFKEARPNLPVGFAAPLQRELAPEEEEQGISRDSQSRRLLRIDPSFINAMRVTWDKLSPQGWALFCESWGLQWGRLLMIDLETESLEKQDKSVRELPTREALHQLAKLLKEQGWGDLSFDFSSTPDGTFVITMNRSAIAESVGKSETPRCQLMSGVFQAMFTTLSQRVVFAQEATCQSQGHERCSFVVINYKRKQALQSAIQSEQELGKVLAKLKESHRGNL
jgi:photoactive yellow protein